jgi:hypothetical protein
VATTSAEDPVSGYAIADALDRDGHEGVVTIEEFEAPGIAVNSVGSGASRRVDCSVY